MYKDLSLKEKAKVIREGVRLGLNSIDDILSLYDEAISYLQGGPIVSSYGQWKYPGKDTIIPSNNITMDNVNYPVLGISDTGDTKIMMPWNDYKFRGSVVYEHPLIGNQFQLGGNTKPTFDLWYPTVPNQKNDTSSYDLRRAYNILPFDEMEKFRTINDYHLPSVAYDEKTDTYTFLKRNGHPTLNYELDWYNSGSPDALEFRERYKLDTLSLPWRYIPRTYLKGGNTLKYLNVPEYNIALYNTVSPLGDFPNFWEALAYKRLVKDKLKNGNIYKRDYKVGDTQGEKTAMAAWAKRLGIPYDEQDLPVYNGDTVTLPNSLVLEIPYDTNMLKTRIQLNKALLDKYSKYRYNDVVDAAIKADLYNLDKLRETYKTGKPVGLTEFGWNSRLLVDNGEIIPIENIQSPLNVLGNYNVRYSPEERRLYYSDEYDFNQFENFVPGEPYRIRGYIDLDNNKALGGNLFKKGGIYIKPENRGKFTALKKRTGHSASWFKAHGTPALKKMATFALNARHWKHDDGGHLFLEDGQIFKRPQDDLTGRNILTSPILPPKSYYEQFTIPELEPKKPQPLQPLEGTYGNKYSELVPMSDGTYVNNPINKGLQLDWRTHALEFAPLLAIGAGPAIGSTTTWLATSKPALYNLGRMTLGSEIGGRSVDLASLLFTSNTWGLNVGNVVEDITGWNPNNTMVGLFVTESLNPGYFGKESLASLAGLFSKFGKKKPNILQNNYSFTSDLNPFKYADNNDTYNKIKQIQKDAKINYILTGEEPSGAVKSFFFELPKEGVDFYKTPITTLTKEVFDNLVFPRLFKDPNRIEDFELLYGSDYGIGLAKKQMIKDVYAQKQYMVKPELYEALETLKGSTAGVNYENKGVLIKDIPDNLSYAEGHELRHTTQSVIPRTENEENILSSAYNDVPNPYKHDYDMSKEWETMNFDARKAVLGDVHGKASVETLNKIIEKMSNAQFINRVYKSDGYWRHYIDDLVDKSGIEGPREFVVDEMLKTPEFQLKIKSWKDAMMKVGAVSGVIVGASNNKDKK